MVPEEIAAVWRQVAERVRGTYRSPSGVATVQRRDGDWILTLERMRTDTGYLTRLRAPFHNPRRVRLRIRHEGVMDDLWKKLGFVQEVDTGVRSFDARFLVKGTPRAVIRELLEDGQIRAGLQAQRHLDLRIVTRLLEPTLRPGVDELRFREWGEATPGVERLVDLFDLFRAMLPVLSPRKPGWEQDPDVLVRRLRAPGGRVVSPFGYILWDGDRPRRDAAARLGAFRDRAVVDALLEALTDDDEELVAAAMGSLGEIGDARAVSPLLELLGERRRAAEGRTLAAHAGDALRALGRGAEVGAFDRALAGEPDGLRPATGDTRAALVRALMAVVDSAEFGPRSEAARALGALGAREALPLLRDKTSAMGMRTRLTEAATEAVEAIEARASLPRPAEGPPAEPDTLPRPADPSAHSDPGTLPRPAEPERDERG